MQTDAWLTDTPYPDRCPLCSQPLAGGSNACPACGFIAHEPAINAPVSSQVGQEKPRTPPGNPAPGTANEMLARAQYGSPDSSSNRNKEAAATRSRPSRQPNPITPIPARASAQRAQSRPGTTSRRGRSEPGAAPTSSSAALPTQRGGSKQHESPNYEVASSLSSLSLIISETPTAPPRSPRSTGNLEHIDEIDTVPQLSDQTRAGRQSSGRVSAMPSDLPETPIPLRFDDLAVANLAMILSEVTPPVAHPHIDEIDTVPEVGSTTSRALAPLQPAIREVAVDGASWTAGPDTASSLAARFIVSRSPRRRRARTFNPLDRTRWWLLRPGRIEFFLWTLGSLLLFGVTFLILLATVLSVMLPGLQVSGNFPTSAVKASSLSPVATSALSSSLRLTLSGKNSLLPGSQMHLQGTGFHPQSKIVFLLDGRLPLLDQYGKAASVQTDAAGRFTVSLWLGQGQGWSSGSHKILAREAGDSHQVTVAITIAAPSTTSITGNPGVQNTPVPPANPTPTPVPVHPTPTAKPPVPTSTPGVTPTLSPPAKGATVTPGLPGGTPTATAGSSALGNSLNSTDSNSLFARLTRLNPLIWLIGFCYLISMLLLGVAGVLRRRHH